jgi:hypothetical protein
MVSEASSFGSLAPAGVNKEMPARHADISKKQNRKSLPRIECLPVMFFGA